MVKLGATILSLPGKSLEFNKNIIDQLDSIEWTSLYINNDVQITSDKVDSMLSIINMQEVSGFISETSIFSNMSKFILEGSKIGIKNFIYGSPKTREGHYMNSDDVVLFFTNLFSLINLQITSKINFYIEPLPNKLHFLEDFNEIAHIAKSINQNLNLLFDNKITVMPLFDTASYLKSQYKCSPEDIVSNTDRIHLSLKDVTLQFDIESYGNALDLVNQSLLLNSNLTISYEHINQNHNHSIETFINYFRK